MSILAVATHPKYFYPRPPRGGRPKTYRLDLDAGNFYPRPPRGGRPPCGVHAIQRKVISIHALREEGDPVVFKPCAPAFKISIHALREEGDHHLHPQQGADRDDFYPRPPRGGRHLVVHAGCFVDDDFYPRPPRGGRRRCGFCPCPGRWNFYPRPPRGGRRILECHDFSIEFISIHALREEGDSLCSSSRRPISHFYPRPPRGGRRKCDIAMRAANPFLSTPSARRATRDRVALRSKMHNFYPRPPRGGRHKYKLYTCASVLFLSTPSARRATDHLPSSSLVTANFYPRPPRGGRPRVSCQ